MGVLLIGSLILHDGTGNFWVCSSAECFQDLEGLAVARWRDKIERIGTHVTAFRDSEVVVRT